MILENYKEKIEVILSIDIGGTSYKGALVNKNGDIIYRARVKAAEYGSNKKFLYAVSNLILKLTKDLKRNNEKLIAMSFSVPGVIDSDNGIIKYSNNLNIEDVHFKEELNQAFKNIPVFMLNDANAATLGEARKGIAKNYSNVVFLTLGTGVGGGVIINNKLYAGNQFTGAELGHMSIDINGEMCTCGRRGCFEVYASARALVKYTKEGLLKYKDSKMWDEINHNIDEVNGSVSFETLKKYSDDVGAKEVVNKYIKYLSEGILNYCNIFRPDIILIGGGVSEQEDYLVNLINEYCEKYYFGFKATPKPIIKTATLKNDAGIIGAAYFALENLKEN